ATLFLALAFLPYFLADFFADFLADFFGAALAFLADLLAFFADFLAVFFAALFEVFFEVFLAVFFFAVRAFFLLLLFLPFLFFFPFAIVILLLPLIHVYRASTCRPLSARGPSISSILAWSRPSPNREAQPCARRERTYRWQSAPCIQYCPQQSCPAQPSQY